VKLELLDGSAVLPMTTDVKLLEIAKLVEQMSDKRLSFE
jgi:hypothetical protein